MDENLYSAGGKVTGNLNKPVLAFLGGQPVLAFLGGLKHGWGQGILQKRYGTVTLQVPFSAKNSATGYVAC